MKLNLKPGPLLWATAGLILAVALIWMIWPRPKAV